ncbi:class I SAM-dependent methyltransferase [Endozoicomonas atrinae]|uniref:class I SAM-dependent methyltransferase n=1 Tax=Endozoicomonas atrinae TaxID=1333660 RepID=UPI000825CC93|nr:class I SAM-dependent methyltransferase [Endozoicomonas atrinae]
MAEFSLAPSGVGYAFALETPLLTYWTDCWQGKGPLLDIGCGDGTHIHAGLKSGADIIGLDLSDSGFEAIHRSLDVDQKARFQSRVGRLPDNIPFHDESVAGALCSLVLHFLDHAETIAAIWEVHRILEPGGRFVFTCVSDQMAILDGLGLQQQFEDERKSSPLFLSGMVPDFVELLEKQYRRCPASQQDEALATLERYRRDKLSIPLHFFNLNQLIMVLLRLGFSIEYSCMAPADHYPIWKHGPEDEIRIVARKNS